MTAIIWVPLRSPECQSTTNRVYSRAEYKINVAHMVCINHLPVWDLHSNTATAEISRWKILPGRVSVSPALFSIFSLQRVPHHLVSLLCEQETGGYKNTIMRQVLTALGDTGSPQRSATRNSFIAELGYELWEHTERLRQDVAVLSFFPAYWFNYQKNFTF